MIYVRILSLTLPEFLLLTNYVLVILKNIYVRGKETKREREGERLIESMHSHSHVESPNAHNDMAQAR